MGVIFQMLADSICVVNENQLFLTEFLSYIIYHIMVALYIPVAGHGVS